MEQVKDGFVNRLMIFESEDPDPKELEPNIFDVPEKLVNQIIAWTNKPSNYKRMGNVQMLSECHPYTVMTNEHANEALKAFKHDLRGLREQLRTDQRPAEIYIRTAQQAEQIALILAGSDNIDSPEISEQNMDYAIKLTKYLADNLLRIVESHVSSNYQDNLTKKVKQTEKEKISLEGAIRGRENEIKNLVESLQIKAGVDRKKLSKLINDLIGVLNISAGSGKTETLKTLLGIFDKIPVEKITCNSIEDRFESMYGGSIIIPRGRTINLEFMIYE